MFITLLVLLCFNLLGEGFEVALPRVIDTLIGCAIAWAAVSFIWPDWRFRNLPRVLDRAMNANCRYLDAILEQYHQGRDNRLAYRIARRDAHNSDAELASVVSNMSTEPGATAEMRETAFRLLCLNHTFTSYISTLGAHREKLTNPAFSTCWMMPSAMSMMHFITAQPMNRAFDRLWMNWLNALRILTRKRQQSAAGASADWPAYRSAA
jgi:uncharacterized membrane protein (TIGR01666 family)